MSLTHFLQRLDIRKPFLDDKTPVLYNHLRVVALGTRHDVGDAIGENSLEEIGFQISGVVLVEGRVNMDGEDPDRLHFLAMVVEPITDLVSDDRRGLKLGFFRRTRVRLSRVRAHEEKQQN